MERFAIIDLGTNTFNLLIFEVESILQPFPFKTLFKDQQSVKLGKMGINKDIIQADAIVRGLNALHLYKEKLLVFKVQKYRAIGTSALRNASNSKAFIDEVALQLGIKIEVISGEKEAEYIFKGVQHSLTFPSKPSLIMDIGGGSVEFILVENKTIVFAKSYNIGAARLLEKFHHSNPIEKSEVDALIQHLSIELEELIEYFKSYTSITLIGSSGSFDSYLEMLWHQHPHLPINFSASVNSLPITLLKELLLRTSSSTKGERKNIKGLVEFRRDMMVVSCLLTLFILDHLPVDEVLVSSYALKEGLITDCIINPQILK